MVPRRLRAQPAAVQRLKPASEHTGKRMRGRRLTALLLTAVLLAACTSPEERAERARREAREALVRGDRTAALDALDELRDSGAEPVEALLGLARLQVAAGEAPQVRWLLEEGLQRHPDRDDLRLALAQVALLLGDASAARAAAAGIAAGSDQHLPSLLLRAQAELRLGGLDRGLAILVEAEQLYPDRPEARLARIATLLSERRFDEARNALDAAKASLAEIEESREALRRLEVTFYSLQDAQGESDAAIAGLRALAESDPNELQALHALIGVFERADKVQDGIEFLTTARAANPDQLALYPLLAPLYVTAGQPEEAERVLVEFVERAHSPTAHAELARFHLRRQEEQQVFAVLDEALAAFPEDRALRKLRAEAFVWSGRTAEARSDVERFASDFPDDPNGEYLRARLELAEGDAAAAAARFEKLVPRLDRSDTQYWLGRALEQRGDRAGAERRYGLAVARNPADPALYPPLLRLAEQRGDWATVAAVARVLVRRAPDVFEACAALSTAAVNLGNGEAAERAARRCMEEFPDSPQAPVLLARALRTKREYGAALAQLEATRARFGASPQVDAERAITLGLAGRLEEGVTLANESLAANPDSAELFVALAALLFKLGRAHEGADAVDRALALSSNDPTPLAMRAEFRAATGRYEEAREDCERYLALRSDDPNVHMILAVVDEKSGSIDAAIASYRRAAELDDKAFAPRNNLALLLAERDLDAALVAAQEAYAIAPGNHHVLDTLGWLYLEKGLVDRSISLLAESHARAPEQTSTQLHLALAYREAGRGDDARDLLMDLLPRVEGADRARVDDALRALP